MKEKLKAIIAKFINVFYPNKVITKVVRIHPTRLSRAEKLMNEPIGEYFTALLRDAYNGSRYAYLNKSKISELGDVNYSWNLYFSFFKVAFPKAPGFTVPIDIKKYDSPRLIPRKYCKDILLFIHPFIENECFNISQKRWLESEIKIIQEHMAHAEN